MKQISVLYEDNELMVFNKPAGMLVIPAPGKTRRILTEIVNQQAGEGAARLYPCHRLDQQTSGVIIYAKGKKNQQRMRELFQRNAVQKTYITFVKGRFPKRSGTIRTTIKDFHQQRFSPKSRGKLAVTHYQVVNEFKGFSVVKVRPETGRTNQIRIHFSEMGHPLLGERVYAFRKDFDVDMKRLALHSRSVSFRHPVSGKEISVVCELPEDMQDFLDGFSVRKRNREA